MARNAWERHHEKLARAAVNPDKTVLTEKTSGFGSKTVVCTECSGTGLAARVSLRRTDWAILCKDCNGRGFVAVAQPKKTQADFGLSTPVRKDTQC